MLPAGSARLSPKGLCATAVRPVLVGPTAAGCCANKVGTDAFVHWLSVYSQNSGELEKHERAELERNTRKENGRFVRFASFETFVFQNSDGSLFYVHGRDESKSTARFHHYP